MDNCKEILYCTAIYLAAENGHRDTVKHLTKMDVILSEDVVDKFTAFYMAARNGSLDIIKYFIDDNYLSSSTVDLPEEVEADTTDEKREPNTPDLLMKVLDNTLGVNNEDANGNTCLHYAALQGNLTVVHHLLKHGADPRSINNCQEKPIHVAASNGFTKIVQMLVENGTNINASNENKDTPLHLAAQNGHTNVVQGLLKLGALSLRNNFGYLPIHYSKNNEIELMLLDQEVEDYDDTLLLHTAVLNGHIDVIKSVLKYDTKNINDKYTDGNTTLHIAAQFGYEDAIKLLLDNGADIESRNTLSYTPLHFAISNNQFNVAFVLIEAGADYQSKTSYNSNPLHFAAQFGSKELVEWFIKKGVDVKIGSNYRSTLMYAASNGHDLVCGIILDFNADIIDDIDGNNQTALHFAVDRNKINVVKVLLKYRAKLLKDKNNQTPLDVSRLKGYDSITHLLENKYSINKLEA